MSDTQSQHSLQSFKSSATNRSKIKICGYCGKAEGPHYAYHNKEKHPGQEPLIWDKESDLLEAAWCTNWREIVDNPKAKAIGKLSIFEKGFGSAKSIAKRSSVNGSRGDAALSQDLGDDDVERKNII
jgi:hypothetical protein